MVDKMAQKLPRFLILSILLLLIASNSAERKPSKTKNKIKITTTLSPDGFEVDNATRSSETTKTAKVSKKKAQDFDFADLMGGNFQQVEAMTVMDDSIMPKEIVGEEGVQDDHCLLRNTCAGFKVNPILSRNCFCDDLCLTYKDCCQDYIGSSNVTVVDIEPEVVSCRLLEINYKNSKGGKVFIVDRCPKNYTNNYVQNMCELGNETFHRLPVNGLDTQVLYRNVFCAVCNGDENNVFWTVELDGCKMEASDIRNSTSSLLESNYDCEHVLVFPTGMVPRPCKTVVNNCGKNWTDVSVAGRCLERNYTSYVYDVKGETIYRNQYCAACNYNNRTTCIENSKKSKGGINFSPFDPPPYSIILDLNSNSEGVRDNRVGSGQSNLQSTVQLMQCEPGFIFDPFSRICRSIFCQTGFLKTDHGCEISQDEAGLNRTLRLSIPGQFPSTNILPCITAVQFNRTEFEFLDNGSVIVFQTQTVYTSKEYLLNLSYLYICPSYSISGSYNITTNVTVMMFKFDRIQGFLSFVGVLVSLTALLIQFVVYMMFPVLRNIPGKCIICLVVALFISQLTFLFSTPSSDSFPGPACFYLAILMHYAYLATFFWMNVMAIDICRTFSSNKTHSDSFSTSKRFTYYSIYAWITPLVIVLLATIMDLLEVDETYRPHYGDGICWISSRMALLLFFAVPLSAILLANIFLFSVTVYYICLATKQSRYISHEPESKGRLFLYIKLSAIMGLTWIFGFLATLTEFTFLWYAFIVFNSLQGLFVCVTFVLTKKVFRLMHALAPSKTISSSSGNTLKTKNTTYCRNLSNSAISTQQTGLSHNGETASKVTTCI